MTMTTDKEFDDFLLSNPTEEELDEFIANAGTKIGATARPAGTDPVTGKPLTAGDAIRSMFGADKPQDTSLGYGPVDLARAGAGSELNRMYQGAKHGMQMLFAPDNPEAKKAMLARIAKERGETATIDKMLMENPSAKLGSFLGNAAVYAAAPARIPAQMALAGAQGFLNDPQGETEGLANDIAVRGSNAALQSALTGVVGKGVQVVGKTLGAAAGKFTDAGKEAMALRDAAKRELGIDLGLPELDKHTWLSAFARRAPGYEKSLQESAGKLAESMQRVKQVPSLSGRSTSDRMMPGEDLRIALADSAKRIEAGGRARWEALDDYLLQNNVPQVKPDNFLPTVENIGKTFTSVKNTRSGPVYKGNEVFDRVADYNDQAASWLKMMAGTPTGQQGSVPFSALNDIRMAVGKALSRAERDMAAPNPVQATREARNELRKLYATLNTDLESWAKTNAKTGETKQLFDEANAYWRERMIPDVVQNRLARKVMQGEIGAKPRSFESAEQMYGDILGKGGEERVARLAETLSPRAKTQIDVLRTLDAAAPRQPDGGLAGLALLRAAQVHPLSSAGMGTVLPHAPGIRWASRSRPIQALHFAEDVLRETPKGRMAFGAAQYPEDAVETRTRRVIRGE